MVVPSESFKTYLSRTNQHRGGRQRVFLPIQKGKKTEVTATSISAWLCNTVHTAYQLADDEAAQLYSVKGHNMRFLSASWGVLNNVAVKDVMKAVFWHHQTTFINHYLRDLTQQVVVPPKRAEMGKKQVA